MGCRFLQKYSNCQQYSLGRETSENKIQGHRCFVLFGFFKTTSFSPTVLLPSKWQRSDSKLRAFGLPGKATTPFLGFGYFLEDSVLYCYDLTLSVEHCTDR